jgi:iron complex outermembrane recepter protein
MSFRKTLALCSASAAVMLAAGAPAWAQNATVDQAPVTAQDTPSGPLTTASGGAVLPAGGDTEVEALVVTGTRRSVQSATAIRRNSEQIVDAVVAEDIGKLPDVTGAESLARLPGVQVERARGEVGEVLIRGLSDELATTTYNGREIFTAETRSVAIQDFPAGGVAALEVYKSSTPNLVEPGIAGLINVRGRRPFDFGGREVSGSVWAIYPYQAQDWTPNGNILLSDRWDTDIGQIGALINVSFQQLHYLDSARFVGGGWIDAIQPRHGTDPSLVGARFSDAVGIFYGEGVRSRPSVNAAVQWRPNDELEIYGDFLWQAYRDEVEDRRLFVPLYGDAIFSNVELFPGTNQVRSLTERGAVPPWMFQGATYRKTDTYQYGIGAVWNRGPWRVSADLARTDSKFEISLYSLDSEFWFRTPAESVVNINFDVDREEGGVEFSFPNFDQTNPANYRFLGIFDRYQDASGDDWQFRTDVTYESDNDFLRQLDFGIRYTDRNAEFNAGDRFGPGGLRPLTELPVDLQLIDGGFRGSDVQQTRTWVSATYDSIRENIDAIRALGGLPAGPPPLDPFQRFRANEKALTGYAQLKYELGALPIDGVVGARVVRTDVSILGTGRVFFPDRVEFTPVERSNDYVDILPSFTARWRLTERLQARFAANMTRTRPAFGDLNPSLTVAPNADNGFRNASGGNPDLEPFESKNVDFALEYFFGPTGSAVLGLFRRDIDGFIARRIDFVDDPIYGPLRLDRPVNLNNAVLQGVEGQVRTFFDFEGLPEWMQGFGVEANFTYIDNVDEELDDISDTTYNLVGLYERGPLSMRLAYNFRSGTRDFCQIGGFGNTGCEYVDDRSRLDFSANYTPWENVTFFFDGTNLLGEPFRNFREYADPSAPQTVLGRYPRDVRYEETIYSLGIRLRM